MNAMEPTGPTHSQAEPPALGDHHGHAIYAMPVFVRVASPDPLRLVEFLTACLDFDVVFAAPGPGPAPSLVHLRRGRYRDVLVTPGGRTGQADASLQVVFAAEDADDIDTLAARAAGAAPRAVMGPTETPWGTRDLAVTDPDGRTWAFTARSAAPRPVPGLG